MLYKSQVLAVEITRSRLHLHALKKLDTR